MRRSRALFASLGFALTLGTAAGLPAADTVRGPTVARATADAGAQDPLGFPRPVGLVRKSYSTSPDGSRTAEIATYHAAATLAEVSALYRNATTAAGWTEGAHSDSGSGLNLVRIIDWDSPAREAEVRFYPAKTGGTDLWVRVFTYPARLASRAADTGAPPPAAHSPAAAQIGAARSRQTGAAPLGPPPTDLAVVCDGDAASHLISWSATAWTNFDVYREDPSGWVQIGDKITATSLHESVLVPPKTKYRVVVRHADGSEGAQDYVWADPPQPGTVGGLAAEPASPGQVRVSWQPLPYATKFRVFVSSVQSEGLLVTGTTATLTGVPAGNCTVRVAPSYTVGTGEELRYGNAWAAVTVYGDRIRILFSGVECVHQTADDPLQLDGKGDEIFVGAYVATVKPLAPDSPSSAGNSHGPPGATHGQSTLGQRPGPNQSQNSGGRGNIYAQAEARRKAHSIPVPVGFVRTKVMGDTNGFPDRIQAGTLSARGGIQTGDFVPSSAIIAAQPGVAAASDRFPLLVWEGDLTAASDYLAIAPVIFEWDKDETPTWGNWCEWWTSPNGLDEMGYGSRQPGSWLFATFSEAVKATDDNGNPVPFWLGPDFVADETRPIGLDDRTGGIPFMHPDLFMKPRGLLLTRANVDGALGGRNAVVIKEEFDDAGPDQTNASLEGKYALYIQIERVLPPAVQTAVAP